MIMNTAETHLCNLNLDQEEVVEKKSDEVHEALLDYTEEQEDLDIPRQKMFFLEKFSNWLNSQS